MNTVYAKRHEGEVPSRDDTAVPFRRVLMWSLATAVVVALVDVAVQQALARWAEQDSHELESA